MGTINKEKHYEIDRQIQKWEYYHRHRPTAFKTKSRQAECSKVRRDLAQP